VTAIDILHLVDRLEELVDRGWRPPVGRKVLVDEEALLNIIDQMRICIPKEIKEAAELQAQRDRYLAKAQELARRIIAQARDEAQRMLDEDEVRAQARADAESMVQQARDHALHTIAGADRYAEEQLRGLEQTTMDLQRVVQRGLEALAERRARREAEERAASEEPAPVDAMPSDDAEEDAAEVLEAWVDAEDGWDADGDGEGGRSTDDGDTGED